MNKNDLTRKIYQKAHLLSTANPEYRELIDTFFNWSIKSDHIENDISGNLLKNKKVKANILCKQDLTAGGIEEIEYFLKKYPKLTFHKKARDGDKLKKGEIIGTIAGDNKLILSLERTLLNIMQRMSGIATQTSIFAGKLSPVFVAATRKTPLGMLDKKAVADGGGLTHRLNLMDGILIKDNHLKSISEEYGLRTEAKAVEKLLEGVLRKFQKTAVEIEVDTKEGAIAAMETYVRVKNTNNLVILLDNWTPADTKKFIKETGKNPAYDSIIFEASGNINEDNMRDWAGTGVNVISSGALTHSIKAADISLDFIK